MSIEKILVLGATGMLGKPVVSRLVDHGYSVRILVRDAAKAAEIFSSGVEIVQGDLTSEDSLSTALAGCDAVHISLPEMVEFDATREVIRLASRNQVQRITYVSATTAMEENKSYPRVEVKLRTERLLKDSGIPYVVFCPTWAMETLTNFARGNQVTIIQGKNPPPLHFFAGDDFGRIVAASHDDKRALGKRLFVHGPEEYTLPEAIERYGQIKHPQARLLTLKLWQARVIALLTGNEPLKEVCAVISYFDRVPEMGDPTETNALFGAPAITLDEWLGIPG